MKKPARVWAVTAGMLALGAWALLGVSGNADDKKAGAIGDIEELSDAVEKNNGATVKKLSKEIADKYEDLDKIMHLFKPRNKKGLGVGATPKAVNPDGIELKLLDLSKKEVNKGQLAKSGTALERMGYNIAAIATVTQHKPPAPNAKDWEEWTSDLKKAGLNLAKAAKGKDADGVNKAVSKLNASCASCHEKYRKNN